MTTEWDRDVRSFFRTLVGDRPPPMRSVIDALLRDAIELADQAERARNARREGAAIREDFAAEDPVGAGEAFRRHLEKAGGGPA